MRLIGVTGKKGSGKTEAADALCRVLGYTTLSFADPLRDVCRTVFGLTDDELNDRKLKESPLTRWPFQSPRELMQLVGTDMFRHHFPEVWITAFTRKYRSLDNPQVVVPDVRFINEEKAIRALGGVIIRIERDLPSSDQHPSETEMDEIQADFTILNLGSLSQLKSQILNTVALASRRRQ